MANNPYTENISSMSASSMSSSSINWRPVTTATLDTSALREQIKRELIEDLKRDGLVIGKSPMKELTEERMNRRIDQILENSDEKDKDK